MRKYRASLFSRQRLADLLVMLYCLAMIFTGVTGLFGTSSGALDRVGWVTMIYSAGLIGAGCVGTFACYAGLRRTEMVVFVGFALLTGLHTFLLFITVNAAYQTGWRILAASVGVWALAWVRWESAFTRRDVEDYVSRMKDEDA